MTAARDTIGIFDEELFDELVVIRRHGPVTIAYNMASFPAISADNSDPTGSTVSYNITFNATFQPLATANPTNVVTLHNITFIRSKNLAH